MKLMRAGAHRPFLLLFALLAVASIASAQSDGVALPQATAGFAPRVTYEMDAGKAWRVVTAAINDNQIPIESASTEANQIRTGYRVGPSDGGLGGGLIGGALITQYKFVVSLVPISSSQTKINISAQMEARRLASGLGKMLGGNNAVSDQMWHEVTKDNPTQITMLQDWLYEQIEKRESSIVPTASAMPPPATAQPGRSGSAAAAPENLEGQLARLKELRRKNVISEVEYKAMRAKALGL